MSPKKIAIISDIHANIYALNAFLEYINQHSDVEFVINLGDFISDGPNPCEVFDTIMQDKRFINILGQKEHEIVERVELSATEDPAISTFDPNDDRWLIEILGKDRIQKLKELKPLREVEILGKKILLTYFRNPHFTYLIEKSLADILYNDEKTKKIDKEMFSAFDYIFYGGSHFQQLSSCSYPHPHLNISYKIIDPGALCCLKNNLAGFAIITFDGVNENISFESIEFDLSSLIEDLYKFDVPVKEGILASNYYIDYIEDVLEKNENLKKYILHSGDLSIGWYKHREDGHPIVNIETLRRIIKICLKRSKYITFGCWDNDKLVIDEILNTMAIVKKETSDINGQIWFTGEITEKVITLITENLTDNTGKVKWFDLSLHDSLSTESNQTILIMAHFASQIYLYNVGKEDLIEIKSILDRNEVHYHVSPSKQMAL